MSFVLDTCALIWWTLDPEKLSSASLQAIAQMEQEKNGYVASILSLGNCDQAEER